MKPYYEENGIRIYHGDSREIAPCLEYDVVITDPPWGRNTAVLASRFTRKPNDWWKETSTKHTAKHRKIEGDDCEFDPRPWITKQAVLFGANYFTRHLPHSGGWLIWDKRLGVEDVADKGWPLGEAELAWTNVMGHTRVFRNRWMGLLRSEQQGEFYHPTQKPVSLMRWALQFVPNGVPLDPFMGSGTTLRAAKDLGRKAIGIEIEERYCEIAANRLRQEVLAFA